MSQRQAIATKIAHGSQKHAHLEAAEHGQVCLTDDKAEEEVDQSGNALPCRAGLQGLNF